MDPGKRISEDRQSLFEGYAMLTPVCGRFRGIPGETNPHAGLGYTAGNACRHGVVQRCLSISALAWRGATASRQLDAPA